MKKFKKILALALSLAMVLGMSVTTFASGGTTPHIPNSDDKANITINGITGSPQVTLYQLTEAKYGDDGNQFIKFEFASNVNFTENNGKLEPTADDISRVANGLLDGTITPKKANPTPETVNNGTYTKNVGAGIYIAVLTGANDGSVYNPILLTATYGPSGELTDGTVNLGTTEGNAYLHGSTATAKKTSAGIEKTVTAPGAADNNKTSASIGDELTYTITATMPSYPAKAVNKTFFISDTMSVGQTFLYSTLTIKLQTAPGVFLKDGEGHDRVFTADNNGVFKLPAELVSGTKKGEGETEVSKTGDFAKAAATIVGSDNKTTTMLNGARPTGFYLNFDYDELTYTAGGTADHVYIPVVTYKSVLNENAVVGGDGNKNEATLYYSNKPNQGNTHKTLTEPDPDDPTTPGLKKDETDQTVVYTYQLAFHKIGEGDQASGLGGAKFGIYKANGDNLGTKVDEVTTNSAGYAVSSKVAAGKYYIQELEAPDGYSLSDKVYEVTVTSAAASKTITEVTKTYITSTETGYSDTLPHIGWFVDGVFYPLDKYAANTQETDNIKKAYLKDSSTTITEIPSDPGSGTVTEIKVKGGNKVDNIPNTKLNSLPSTGGIGTTIFTIGGCAIMILAAGLYFASRRRSAK